MLTQETVRDSMADPALAELRQRITEEGRAIASAHGIDPTGAPLPPPHASGGPAHQAAAKKLY